MIRCAALLAFAAALDCVWRSSVHGASGWADASCTRLQAKDAARLPVEDLPRALQQLPKLMELHLSSLQLGDRRFEDLCKVFMQGHHRLLERLYLAHNNLGTPGALALAQSLPKLPNLKVLNLPENAIRAPGAAALAEALQSTPSLEQLVLAGNGIGVPGAQAVAQAMPQLRQLQDLHLSRNLLGTQGALALARALHSGHGPALEWLSLSENSVGDVGLQALAVGLRRTPRLEWLDLDANGLTDLGVSALGRALCRATPELTLRELTLQKNVGISAEGHKWLQAAKTQLPGFQFWMDPIANDSPMQEHQELGEKLELTAVM